MVRGLSTPRLDHCSHIHSRFCLREIVLVNKQALRLASLSEVCEEAGRSSRRGTAALTTKQTGVWGGTAGQRVASPVGETTAACL